MGAEKKQTQPNNHSPTANANANAATTKDDHHRSLIFTYGTLKRGFSNHWLTQELINTNDAVFLGAHRTVKSYPLVCGPYGVPFLLNFPGAGDRISGELYAVSEKGLARLDELEGTSRKHYERLPVEIVRAEEAGGGGAGAAAIIKAEAYYGHGSYAKEMWKKNGEKGFCEYTAEEAKGYVKRKDRPGDISFVDQIRFFISSSD